MKSREYKYLKGNKWIASGISSAPAYLDGRWHGNSYTPNIPPDLVDLAKEHGPAVLKLFWGGRGPLMIDADKPPALSRIWKEPRRIGSEISASAHLAPINPDWITPGYTRIQLPFISELQPQLENHPMQDVLAKIYKDSRKRDQGENDERSVATDGQLE